ncbi:hypothetical protein CEP53_005311 [Fusarium sp. AF-6]|nr:hypothetical protein CEP53_005311 [Fusarium sp. AF-6]
MTGVPVPVMERLYLGRWKHEFEVSERTAVELIHGGTPATIQVFLRSETSKLQITEAILRQSASRPPVYQLLPDRRNKEVDVSEAEAIQAIEGGPQALRRCLDKPGTNFQVTETIFKAAMLSGADVAEMLFSKRESEVNILQEVQEIYQLREDLRRHVLETLGRTEHTTMFREALARYENLNNSETRGSATAAALGETTTDIVQWLRNAGMRISRWRTVHELFRELMVGRDILDIGSGADADELEFQGDSGGDVDVEQWLELRARHQQSLGL